MKIITKMRNLLKYGCCKIASCFLLNSNDKNLAPKFITIIITPMNMGFVLIVCANSSIDDSEEVAAAPIPAIPMPAAPTGRLI
jgi:hypothetical protein